MNSTFSNHEDSQPWTTSRCNRLLRPLSSRLVLLRKELEKRKIRAATATKLAHDAKAQECPEGPSVDRDRKWRNLDKDSKGSDPDWVPSELSVGGANRKRTYGGRPVKRAPLGSLRADLPSFSRPGEVSVPTPIISRNLDKLDESPGTPALPFQLAGQRRKPPMAKWLEDHQILREQEEQILAKQYKGLFTAYWNLLRATKSVEDNRRGTRSLMATCLRKVPACIAVEEYWAAKDSPDAHTKRDIADEMYTTLEKMGTAPGKGWPHLREVLRSHATTLVADAICEGLFGPNELRELIYGCLTTPALEEAEKFLESYFAVLEPLPRPTSVQADMFSYETSPYMALLHHFVVSTQRWRFLYTQLERMISEGLLPLEWLATRHIHPILSRLVRILAEGNHRDFANAFRLLETMVSVGTGGVVHKTLDGCEVRADASQPKPSRRFLVYEALDTTFSSLFTLLTSITLVSSSRQQSADNPTVPSGVWVLHSLTIRLLNRGDMRSGLRKLGSDPKQVNSFKRRALWCAMSSLLVRLQKCPVGDSILEPGLDTLVSSFDSLLENYPRIGNDTGGALDSLPTFVCSVAKCYGKAGKDDGFNYLQQLVDALLAPTGLTDSRSAWNLKRVALDAALEFAEMTRKSEHLAYSRQMERLLSKAGQPQGQPPTEENASLSVSNGFRWEEGIGEWVACTPFPRKQVKRVPHKASKVTAIPTPETSQDEDEEDLLEGDTLVEDTEDVPDSDDTLLEQADVFEQSSPIKKKSRLLKGDRNQTHPSKRPIEDAPQSTPKRTRLLDVVSSTDSDDSEVSEYSDTQPKRRYRLGRYLFRRRSRFESEADDYVAQECPEEAMREDKDDENASDDEYDGMVKDEDENTCVEDENWNNGNKAACVDKECDASSSSPAPPPGFRRVVPRLVKNKLNKNTRRMDSDSVNAPTIIRPSPSPAPPAKSHKIARYPAKSKVTNGSRRTSSDSVYDASRKHSDNSRHTSSDSVSNTSAPQPASSLSPSPPPGFRKVVPPPVMKLRSGGHTRSESSVSPPPPPGFRKASVPRQRDGSSTSTPKRRHGQKSYATKERTLSQLRRRPVVLETGDEDDRDELDLESDDYWHPVHLHRQPKWGRGASDGGDDRDELNLESDGESPVHWAPRVASVATKKGGLGTKRKVGKANVGVGGRRTSAFTDAKMAARRKPGRPSSGRPRRRQKAPRLRLSDLLDSADELGL